MGSETDNGKHESIERWLEFVSEETSPTTQEEGAQNQQHSPTRPPDTLNTQPTRRHSLPTRLPDTQPTKLNNHPSKLSENMPKKRAASPLKDEAGRSKRPNTRASKREAETSTITRSVHFPPDETLPDSSHKSHQTHSTSTSARALRVQLCSADPGVLFLPVESKDTPDAVSNLISSLIDKLEDAVPDNLRAHVKTIEKGGRVELGDMNKEDADIWKYIRATTSMANTALMETEDENEWMQVPSYILKTTMNSEEEGLFAVKNVATAAVGPPALIPTLHGRPIAFKKIDLAVVFSGQEPQLKRLYTGVMKRHDSLWLTQSEDPSLRRLSQFIAIEIKSPDGSYYGASVQLGIWLAAGLEKHRQLRELAAEWSETETASQAENLLPSVGISVTGHVWNLHFAWKCPDGTVQIYGPLLIGDTGTTRGTFLIAAALEFLKSWGEGTYYPWLLNGILLPLAGEMESHQTITEESGPEAGGSDTKGKQKQRMG